VQADRLPPHDIQAEESVIGSLLIDGESISHIIGFLLAGDFYRERNRLVYEAACGLFERKDAINQVTIAHELESRGQLEDVGGSAFLAHTVGVVPTSVHIEHYGRIVKRTATMRRLIAAANDIADIGYADDPNIETALSRAEDMLFGIRTGQQSRDFIPLRDALSPFLETSPLDQADSDTKDKPVPTGFRNLDRLLGGFQRSDMIVLAARPSIGKSTLGLNFAMHAAQERRTVAIFSLEMGREQIGMRLLAGHARLNMHDIRMRHLGPSEEAKLIDSIGFLSDLAIFIDDTPFQSVMEMRSKARRLQLEHGVDFIVVDYMQLIDSPNGRPGGANRAQEVSDISRQMKGMARDLNVPVLAISQLSRAIEHRQSHRPVLSDLRESGSIEQDADVVMFIHREEKFTTEQEWNKQNPNQPYPRGLCELIIAKHRHGPTDEVWMAVRDEIGRFIESMAPERTYAPERV